MLNTNYIFRNLVFFLATHKIHLFYSYFHYFFEVCAGGWYVL